MNRFRLFAVWTITLGLGFPLACFAAAPLLKPHEPIEVPNSRGGFNSIQVDNENRRLLLNHTGNGTLDIIDLKTEKLAKQIKAGTAMAVAIDPQKNRYYVSVGAEKKLVLIDSEKLESIGEMALPGPGGALTIGPAGVNRVFVAHADGTDLWVIDPNTKQIVSTLKIPAGPEAIIAEYDTSLLYVNVKSDDSVVIISASDNNTTIGGAWPTAPAKKSHAMALDVRAPRRLFVAGINGKLAVLDTGGKSLGSVDMVTGVNQIALDAAKERLYCAGSNGKMTVLDTSGNSVKPLGDITTARGAKAVAVDHATHAVWLAYFESGKCYARKFTP